MPLVPSSSYKLPKDNKLEFVVGPWKYSIRFSDGTKSRMNRERDSSFALASPVRYPVTDLGLRLFMYVFPSLMDDSKF